MYPPEQPGARPRSPAPPVDSPFKASSFLDSNTPLRHHRSLRQAHCLPVAVERVSTAGSMTAAKAQVQRRQPCTVTRSPAGQLPVQGQDLLTQRLAHPVSMPSAVSTSSSNSSEGQTASPTTGRRPSAFNAAPWAKPFWPLATTGGLYSTARTAAAASSQKYTTGLAPCNRSPQVFEVRESIVRPEALRGQRHSEASAAPARPQTRACL